MEDEGGGASVKRDEGNRCYLPWLYHCETGIAKRAALLRLALKPLPKDRVKAAIDEAEIEAGKGFAYSAEQREGIAQGVNQGLFILTGGPGTGKTTTVLGLLRVLTRGGLEVKLAAPTGRAAKRMSEVTGHPASTLHRLLKYDATSKGFAHGEGNPLPGDALILDEMSMIDTALMYAVLKSVKPGMRIILVGDPDQLPSVGPGKVLAELIDAGVIPHLHLSQVFRQAESSLIVTNAHRIRQGMMPEKRVEANYHFVERGDPASLLEACLEVVCTRLPQRFGFDPFADVQVLTPMNQGPLGMQALNQALQERLNPDGPFVTHRDRRFRERDRVMQLKNNYDKNVFNGDVGYVVRADPREKNLLIDFDGEKILFEEEDFDQLTLAYAATIHKSQGSEFKAVVCLMAKAHWVMLQRNLLYTAVTRAREQLMLLGQWAALHRAVSHNPTVDRNTQLARRLREEVGNLTPVKASQTS
jgi:exodeoxyribonuclease V alpha subunit